MYSFLHSQIMINFNNKLAVENSNRINFKLKLNFQV
jgi:hypothetical protein